MWYFAWILGLGFAVLLAIVNAIWLEFDQDRIESFGPKKTNTKDEKGFDRTSE